MRKFITTLLRLILFFGLGIGLLYFLYINFDASYQEQCKLDGIAPGDCSLLQKVIADFRSVDPFWMSMVVLVFLISNVSRALRWNMLIRTLGFKPWLSNTFLATMAGYLANMALPRMGEVVKPGLVARHEKIPLDKLIGTIVLDRVLDVLCLGVVVGIAFILEFDKLWSFITAPREGQEESSFLILYILAGFGLLALLVVFIFHQKIMASAFYNKIKKLALGFWEGIQTIRHLESPGLFFLHTANIWLMYFFMTYFCFFSFHATEQLSATTALIVFTFATLGIVVPSPGGMGSYHYLVSQGLILYGLDKFEAFSYSNIAFFSIIFVNIAFGIFAFVMMPVFNKNRVYEDKQTT